MKTIIKIINVVLACAIIGLFGAIQYLKHKRFKDEEDKKGRE